MSGNKVTNLKWRDVVDSHDLGMTFKNIEREVGMTKTDLLSCNNFGITFATTKKISNYVPWRQLLFPTYSGEPELVGL
jgi:hypothetical protein